MNGEYGPMALGQDMLSRRAEGWIRARKEEKREALVRSLSGWVGEGEGGGGEAGSTGPQPLRVGWGGGGRGRGRGGRHWSAACQGGWMGGWLAGLAGMVWLVWLVGLVGLVGWLGIMTNKYSMCSCMCS